MRVLRSEGFPESIRTCLVDVVTLDHTVTTRGSVTVRQGVGRQARNRKGSWFEIGRVLGLNSPILTWFARPEVLSD